MIPPSPDQVSSWFDAGNFAGAVLFGDESWQARAARGLLGEAARQAPTLVDEQDPEARFYAAACLWIAGDEERAVRVLATLMLPCAQRLLALIQRPSVRVLAHLPEDKETPLDYCAGILKDQKFDVRTIGMKEKTFQVRPYADVRHYLGPGNDWAPDFYLCHTLEQQLVPPNLELLACPILGYVNDYREHLHTLWPWLDAVDVLVTSFHGAWREVSAFRRAPVVTYPKVWAAMGQKPVREIDRDIDVLLSGQVIHPFFPERQDFFYALKREAGLTVATVAGVLMPREYISLMFRSKVMACFPQATVGYQHAALESLMAGSVIVAAPLSPESAFFSADEGVVTLDPQSPSWAQELRQLLSRWPTMRDAVARGQKRLDEEFRLPRVSSEYFRFLTVMAARVDKKPHQDPRARLQKRVIPMVGYSASDSADVAEQRRGTNARLARAMTANPSARVYIDATREALLRVLLDGARNPALIADLHRLFAEGMERYQDSLVLAFNALRTAFHLGPAKEVSAKLILAQSLVERDLARFDVFADDDVLPPAILSDYFPVHMYLDATVRLLGGEEAALAEMVRAIVASLYGYLGHYAGTKRPVERSMGFVCDRSGQALSLFSRAHELAPGFSLFALRYAEELLFRGALKDVAPARALLLSLCTTPQAQAAHSILEQLHSDGLVESEQFAAVQRMVDRQMAQSFGLFPRGETPPLQAPLLIHPV